MEKVLAFLVLAFLVLAFFSPNQFKEVFEKYFHETTKFFNQSFNELERASYAGDADLAIAVNNKSREWLGQKALFDNKQEGWELIISNKDIRM